MGRILVAEVRMRINLLGPIAVRTDDGTPVTPSAPKRRAVLSALALELGRTVPITRLIDTVWEGRPPPTARAALHGHITELRRLLDRQLTLTTRDIGYQLDGDPEQVDVRDFEQCCAQACAAADDSDAALPLLHRALDLWRGPALADCGSELLRSAEAPRLVALRTRALQRLGEHLCLLGRGAEAIDELDSALAADPTREQLAAQLMDCLAQAGRRDEALTVHQRTVARLAAELGAVPGPALRAAHQRLTAKAATPRPPTGEPRPAPRPAVAQRSTAAQRPTIAQRPKVSQLPRRNRRFAGRATELSKLDAAIADAAGTGLVGAMGLTSVAAGHVERHPVLVTGPAGVGKTSLVLHWAHQVAERFPDGQLYADLCGFDETEPRDPAEVLAGFLTALGVPEEELPAALDDRSRRYRELLAGRQLLVVLDNARDYAQLAPLLPAAEDTPVTVITSRNRLGDLLVQAGAVPLPLDVLPLTEALDLLRRALDPQRIDAEPQAAAEIAERCDRLPLALRLAAARLAARPDWSLRHLAEEISDEQSRLAALCTAGGGSLGIAATLNLTRRALDAPAERFFGYLGLHPGAVIDPHAAAVLAGVRLAEARTLLAQLDAAHLVEETAPGLFARHDLVRLYSANLAAELGCDQREAAMDRMLDHYLAATAAACAGLRIANVLTTRPTPVPTPAGSTGATVGAALGTAVPTGAPDAEAGPVRLAGADAARADAVRPGATPAPAARAGAVTNAAPAPAAHVVPATRVGVVTNAAPAPANHVAPAAHATLTSTTIHTHTTTPIPADVLPALGTPGQAVEWFRREERAVRGLVLCAEQYGRPALAWRLAHQACALYYQENRSRREWRITAEAGLRTAQACGDPAALVRSHVDLAVVQIEHGEFATATALLERAAALADELGDPQLLHQCRMLLANALVRAGEHERAIPLMTAIVADARSLAAPLLLAQTLNNLANALVVAGRPTGALAHATEAVRLFTAHPDDPKLISATLTRAEALHALGRHRAALATAQHALTLGQTQGNLRIESQTRHFIATVRAAINAQAAPPLAATLPATTSDA
ncbi:DNA-binding SARP family transcriptional activator [Kitasatospora sp. GP30]|uniref:AfsR/SARP family transcriptional regulator n=1 Tax=Kitasatospora sp. GP30 TaxID=3035084 RepID=UPI0015D5B422|nr:BTAD domain-containing putative transcriptional regulator [Kitasatospora sp. GP30]MDH6143831.1 DNA-binding SARP family transcriptional activator [Kitasatospora sp. GP30]